VKQECIPSNLDPMTCRCAGFSSSQSSVSPISVKTAAHKKMSAAFRDSKDIDFAVEMISDAENIILNT
jgi:hypothetical protein